jgi:hypothetical protein
LVYLCFIAGSICLGVHRSRQARAVLEGWANRQGLRLIEAHRAWIWFGPFWLRTGGGHAVFRVRLLTSDETFRTGWARVGAWWNVIKVTDAVVVQLRDAEKA